MLGRPLDTWFVAISFGARVRPSVYGLGGLDFRRTGRCVPRTGETSAVAQKLVDMMARIAKNAISHVPSPRFRTPTLATREMFQGPEGPSIGVST